MLRRVRHATRDRVVRAVQEALAAELAGVRGELAATRAEVSAVAGQLSRLEERVSEVGGGLHGHLTAWERRNRRDVLTAADWQAISTSADFFRAELTDATAHFDKYDTLRAALQQAPAEGLYLEFGVASGATLRVITEHAPAGSVHGFDSFEGLPEHWRSGFTVGAFAAEQLPDVPGAELVVGLFDQTLPGFLATHDEPVAFLHLDADLYSSTVTVLTALAPRMRAGTVLLFDEYFNFPGWEAHEHRAWQEFVQATGVEFEYLGFTADDEQLSLRLLTAPVLPAPLAEPGQFGTSRLRESARV
ncbi:class I SAM-dependent methyltransferase [Modestobacter sp. L9-4]|uniref:class I SAM-dependent methyltransferase n=1 Tax=Modestobacter sp. L9-4 TaxID=2851567 RepID=UPI001C7802FD|nr:class I SAM-dependent methyltransferase [Modestobacter sp. L9-4]QXG74589.1 class I SAM-dependent methyltransferase [Modestobacter sp. L9-4]